MTQAKMQRRKKQQPYKKAIIGSLGLAVVLIAGYSFRSTYYASHFLPKTKIDSVDVSGLTVEEANKQLHERYTKNNFVLNNDGKEWTNVPLEDLGIQTDFTKDLQKLTDEQNQWTWGFAYFAKTKKNDVETVLNEEQFAKESAVLTEQLTTFNNEQKQTKNATINQTDDGFAITPEVVGTNVDIEKVLASLKKDLLAGKGSLELRDYAIQPTILANDKQLAQELKELNALANVKGTYSINGETINIPQDKIKSWLTFHDGHADVDRAKAQEYVAELGAKYNTSEQPTTFKSSKRGEVSVPAGTFGWTIQPAAEAEQLAQSILAGQDFTRTPVTQGSTTADGPLISNTYVEIDLQNQHMWFYQDGKVSLETPIVSGKPSTVTPTGVFYIWNKERNTTLRGTNDDGSKYASPVKYWMPIDWTGVGIHDADWQPQFGGQLWKTVGSHGCINTPPGIMATLFETAPVGTPVIVI